MTVSDKPAEGRLSPISNVYPAHLRTTLIFLCCTAIVFFVIRTYHWPLMWDGQVFHYINFLMAHGMAPYREIYDLNFPGIYLIDGWQIHLFGPGDLAWRFYDFFLLGCMIIAMIVISLPYDSLAGLIAGVLFTLFHAAEGPGNSAQRDEIMTVLLLLGYAFLFQAVRRRYSPLLLPFGLCMGLAISIKPTALPLAALVMLMALWELRKKEPLRGYIIYATIGVLVPAGIVLGFLVHNHALGAFIVSSRRLTLYYAGLMHPPMGQILRGCLPISMFALLPLGLAVALLNRDRTNWERWAVLVGVAFGFASYCIQMKGYKYHRYPFLAFLLLWFCLEFAQAIRRQGWSRRLGFAGLLFLGFFVLPFNIFHLYVIHVPNEYAEQLEADLASMGPAQLQHQVQCLDMLDGCFNALYHLGLVQNTGFLGDLLFFAPNDGPVVDYYRGIFWNGLQTHPPKVIVLSDEWFNWPRGFDKVNHWPEFAGFLNRNYTVSQTRTFHDSSYRIYLLKEKPASPSLIRLE